MRAVQVVTPTGPSGVEICDIEEPDPGPDDVLVEVYRIGISSRTCCSARASTS